MRVLKQALNPKHLLMGSILLMIPLFNVVTSFLVFGYVLNCVAHAIGVRKSAPTYYPLGIVLLKGVLGGLIVIMYSIPMMIAYLFGFSLLSIILAVVTSYIVPAALIHFVDTLKMRSAFTVRSLKRSLSPYYFVTWLGVVALNCIIYLGWGVLALLSGPTIVIPLVLLAGAIYIGSVTSLVVLAQVSKN